MGFLFSQLLCLVVFLTEQSLFVFIETSFPGIWSYLSLCPSCKKSSLYRLFTESYSPFESPFPNSYLYFSKVLKAYFEFSHKMVPLIQICLHIRSDRFE